MTRIVLSVVLFLLTASPVAAQVFASPTTTHSVSFTDTLGTTKIGLAYDGISYWTITGGTTSGDRLAQYDANGAPIANYSPGRDFRSIFRNQTGDLFSRSFNTSTIETQTSPGVFSAIVTLAANSLDAQSKVVLNGAGTEYIAHGPSNSGTGGGTISRWDLSGNSLGTVSLSGYGSVAGENNLPNNVSLAAVGDFWLTLSDGVLSAWDSSGNRLGQTTLVDAGTQTSEKWSMSYARGMVWVVDAGEWQGYEVFPRENPYLFAADGSGGNLSDLMLLDATTGFVEQVIGPIGYSVTGLALHPSGVLFGSTSLDDPVSPGHLIRINPITGAGTLVGDFGIADHTMADLTVIHTGSLFELRGWSEFTGSASMPESRLYRINPETGVATQLSDSGLMNPVGVGLATQPDESIFFSGFAANGLLHSLTAAGVATSVATITGSGQTGKINAMSSWKNGALIGSVEITSTNRALISIDSSTAAASPISSTVDNLDALAFSACTVHAIPNSGFGPGVATWTSVGAVAAVTEDFGLQSQIGAHLAHLSNVSVGGSVPVDVATLESLAGGSLSSVATGIVTEGSAMRIDYETQMDSILSVSGQFVTNETTPSTFNDFAFASTGTASLFADTNSSFEPSYFTTFNEQAFGFFVGEFTPIGSHFLTLGVADVADTDVDTALLVDQVVLHRSFHGHLAGTVEACSVLARVQASLSPVINNIDLTQTTLVPVELTDLPARPAVIFSITPAILEPFVRIEFSDCIGNTATATRIYNLDVERNEDGTRYSKVYHYFQNAAARDGEVCGYQISGLPGAVGTISVAIHGETRIPEAGADPPIVVCPGGSCPGLLEDPDRAAAQFIPEEGGDFRWLDDASLHGKGICTGPDEEGPPMTGNGDIAFYDYEMQVGATGWDCCTYQWTGLDGVDSEVGYVAFQLPGGSFPATPNNDADELLDLCDDDDDNDGLPDTSETNTGIYVSPTDTGTNPLLFDTDGDGFGDWEEVLAGTDPNDINSNPATGVPMLSRSLQSLLALLMLGLGTAFVIPGLRSGRLS